MWLGSILRDTLDNDKTIIINDVIILIFKISPISIPLPWSLEKIYIAGVRPQLQIVYHTLWPSKDLKY